MSDVVIDTSIFIAYLRGISKELEILKTESIAHRFTLFVPHMVVVELFAGEQTKRKLIQREIERLLAQFTLIGLSAKSAKRTGELMRIYKQIPDPIDLMIAAIGMEQNALIATLNEKHFKQIDGVKIFEF